MIRATSTDIRPFSPGDEARWDAYVQAHPQATLFHGLAWSRAVQEAYRHEPMHLMAWREGTLVGVLPLFLVRSVFLGRMLVSVPYGTYGGVLADTPDVAVALAQKATCLCRQVKANHLELRHRDAVGVDLPEVGRYDTFRKQLPSRAQDVLTSLPRKARATARNGLATLGEDCVSIGPDTLDTIYDLYAHSLRRLGSPNYSRTFFHSLQSHFDRRCICLLVARNSKPLAGVVSFVFRDEISPYFSGCLPEGMLCNANNVMYVKLMEHAASLGLRSFDFNRTRRDNSGPYDFKRHHGFEPQPLHYQVFLNRQGPMPNLSPSNPKFALASLTWRKLPLWLTRTAGARITKWIP